MLKGFSSLKDFLARERVGCCFVDTTVLFSASYPFDLFNGESVRAFEHFSELKIPVFTNVNVRAEFLENHRRVLIAECLIDFLEDMGPQLDGPLAEKLKSHRTSYRRKLEEEKSAKMEISQIKMFRRLMSDYGSQKRDGWEAFCRSYLMDKLGPLWSEAQKELDLNFISLQSEDDSPYLNERPKWERAVELMGCYGLASSDAMILNMFLCSTVPILLTADTEMAECADKESKGKKQIFIPDSAMVASVSDGLT
jgi:hypothetical protein